MILNEKKSTTEQQRSDNFDLSKTGIDKYDDMLMRPRYNREVNNLTFKIEWMNPEEYIIRCAKLFNVSFERLFNHRFDKKIKKYRKMMEDDDIKFDMPILNYSLGTQEGLHRAIASMLIDPNELIPVMIIDDWVLTSKFNPNKSRLKYSKHDALVKKGE